jgi:hypothetical protein
VNPSSLPARGEVWWCELPDIGRRPVVALSRDAVIHQNFVQYEINGLLQSR